jgi:O-antigen ligase
MAFCLPFSDHFLRRFFFLGLICLIVRKILEYKGGIRPLFKNTYLNKPVLIFVLTMLLATLFSKYFYESQKVFVARIVCYAAIFFLITETVTTKKRLHIILGSIMITAFIVGMDALWQYFKGIDWFFGYPKSDPGLGQIIALSGPFVKHNSFSGYLELILPLVVFLALARKKWYLSILAFMVLVMLAFSWVYVFQRTSWVSVAFSVIIISFFVGKRYVVILGIFFICMACFLPPVVYERMDQTFQEGGDTNRFTMWKEGFQYFNRSPLIGAGLEGYYNYYKNKGATAMHIHNTYLELLVDAGIMGFFSFLYLLVVFVKRSFSVLKLADKRRKWILGGLLASCFSYFIAGLFSTNMIVGVGFSSMFWMMLSLAVILPDLSSDS